MTAVQRPRTQPGSLSPARINLLRVAYLVLVVGLGVFIWPIILDPSQPMAGMGGVVVSMLGAVSALAVLGLPHPLPMLPILLFEIGWKAIWLLRVALPAWLNDRFDAEIATRFYECIPAVLIALIIPWGYVWKTYVVGERLRSPRR